MTGAQRAGIKQKVSAGAGRAFAKRVDTRFPQPKFRGVRNQNQFYIFEYWLAIPEELHDFIEVRVYRCWPVIKLEATDPDRKDKQWEFIEGKCPFTVENYETEIMQRRNYGSGKYRFDLKEKGGSEKCIVRSYVDAVDLSLYPPIIDYKTLSNVPLNQDYIRDLRKQNIPLPWEDEDENMSSAAGEALKSMGDAITRIAETSVKTSQELADARVEAVRAQVEADNIEEAPGEPTPAEAASGEAMKESFSMVAHAAKASIDMMAKNAGRQYDPVEMMRAAKELVSPPATDGSVRLLVEAVQKQGDQMAQMQKDQFDFVKSIINAKPARDPDSIEGFLQKAKTFKEVGELFFGEREPPPAAVASAAPPAPKGKSIGEAISENIGPIITGITMIGGLAANIIYNMKATQPRNPAEDLQRAQAAMPPIPGMQPMPGMGAPGFQQPAPQPAPAPAANPADPLGRFRFMMNKIAPALEQHFYGAPEFDGHTFAEYILSGGLGGHQTQQGRHAYMTLKESLGRQGFEQLIREHDIWMKLQGQPQAFQKFLDQFFDFDQWVTEQQPETAEAA